MRRALVPLALAPALVAQALTSGSLHGVVRSGDGSPLAGVHLDLEELGTGRRHEAVTGRDGRFRFLGLAPGPCRLTVMADGFAGQRISGLRIPPGGGLELPVELIPMESGMVLDLEAQGRRTAPGTSLGAGLLQSLPLRTRSPAGLADLGPWPLLSAPDLQVDGLDLGPVGAVPGTPGLASLSGARILAGEGDASLPQADVLLTDTAQGGNAFGGGAQAQWGPAAAGSGSRQVEALALSGPLRADRLFAAAAADREDLGDGTPATRGDLRLDWLPTAAQQVSLRALDAEDAGGRDRALALLHRWNPDGSLAQEARLQLRDLDLPGAVPARTWEAAETLGLALDGHEFQAGGDVQQLRSAAPSGAAVRRTGLFLRDAWRILRPLTLDLGLRRDQTPGAGGQVQTATSPRLAFHWRISDLLALSGAHGRFLASAPLASGPALPWSDIREDRLALDVRPLPDLVLTAEGRTAAGRLVPGGGDRDRLRGFGLQGHWQVAGALDLAASWTVLRIRTLDPGGLPDGTLRRIRLWAVWNTRDLSSLWAQDWTLTLLGRLQSGPALPLRGLPVPPPGAPVLDFQLARPFWDLRRAGLEALLDVFDLLDRTRPRAGAAQSGDAGRRIQVGLRVRF